MKKVVVVLIAIAILFTASAAHAETMLKKLGRGMANVLTCPVEIFYRIGEANAESGPIAGITWGLLNGFYRMGTRGLVGAYEVVTFPIPFPRNYKPIIDDPEFFFEEGLF